MSVSGSVIGNASGTILYTASSSQVSFWLPFHDLSLPPLWSPAQCPWLTFQDSSSAPAHTFPSDPRDLGPYVIDEWTKLLGDAAKNHLCVLSLPMTDDVP